MGAFRFIAIPESVDRPAPRPGATPLTLVWLISMPPRIERWFRCPVPEVQAQAARLVSGCVDVRQNCAAGPSRGARRYNSGLTGLDAWPGPLIIMAGNDPKNMLLVTSLNLLRLDVRYSFERGLVCATFFKGCIQALIIRVEGQLRIDYSLPEPHRHCRTRARCA
jgi:hypothetical protein